MLTMIQTYSAGGWRIGYAIFPDTTFGATVKRTTLAYASECWSAASAPDPQLSRAVCLQGWGGVKTAVPPVLSLTATLPLSNVFVPTALLTVKAAVDGFTTARGTFTGRLPKARRYGCGCRP